MATKLGPRQRQAHKPSGTQVPLNINEYQISFDKKAFSDLLRSQGVRLVHYRAIPDPRGMTSRGDVRSGGQVDRSQDGYIYKEVGVVTSFFSSNSKQIIENPDNNVAHAMAYISLPETYDDTNEPILLQNWDRFFLKDIEVRVTTSQFMEASIKGIDRLQYPATCVEHLIDAHGVEYVQGVDFALTDEGYVKWLTQKRPGWHAELSRGVVYSVRYRYTPFFVVSRIIHEIRVAQITDPATMKRKLERLLYQVEVVREHVFQDMNRDSASVQSGDPRFQSMPNVGGTLA